MSELPVMESQIPSKYVRGGKAWFTRVGNCYLFGEKGGLFPFRILVGPDWKKMLVTYSAIVVPVVLFVSNVATIWGAPIIAVALFLLVLTLGFLARTTLSDPGIVFGAACESGASKAQRAPHAPRSCCPRSILPYYHEPTVESQDISGDVEMTTPTTAPVVLHNVHVIKINGVPVNVPRNNTPHVMIRCEMCQIDRPHNASHCYVCGVCVVNLDHHCAWMGKCVGGRNKLYFERFLGMLAILLTYILLMVVITLMHEHYIFDFGRSV